MEFFRTYKRLFIIFILGFSSGLPLSLITSSLQAWFASCGVAVLAIGTLSLISLPYSYRMLWGPIVDRYSLCFLGRRRSWMLLLQALLLVGFNIMAWLSPENHAHALVIVAFFLALCSATQDIVIDAHRVEYLPEKHHALGASVAVLGYRLALFVSGGLALIMASRWGWTVTYRCMGLLMVFGMGAALITPEPVIPSLEKKSFSLVAPLKELLRRKGFTTLVLFIVTYKMGEMFTTTTSGIVMPFLIQGLGFSLETIGYVNKILGLSSIIIGGLVAGILLVRLSLFYCLFLFGFLQASANIFFMVLTFSDKSTALLACAVFFDNFAAGLVSTALLALFMRLANKQFTGTQFSFFIALSTLPRIVSGPVAAVLQMYLGWTGLYQLSVVLGLVFIPFLMRVRGHVEYGQEISRAVIEEEII